MLLQILKKKGKLNQLTNYRVHIDYLISPVDKITTFFSYNLPLIYFKVFIMHNKLNCPNTDQVLCIKFIRTAN